MFSSTESPVSRSHVTDLLVEKIILCSLRNYEVFRLSTAQGTSQKFEIAFDAVILMILLESMHILIML